MVKRTSERTGRSQSELIRIGISSVIKDNEPGPRVFRSMGMGHGDGRPYQRWDVDELHEERVRPRR